MKRGRVWGAAALSWLLMHAANANAIPRPSVLFRWQFTRDVGCDVWSDLLLFSAIETLNSHSSHNSTVINSTY